jgi:hypothetical protein
LPDNDNISPREKFILVEALAFAVEGMSLLPIEHRPSNNIEHMKRMLEALVSADPALATFQGIAQRRLGALLENGSR